ncbi:MAG: hypothetical protein RI894_2049 [Bacteroidota bacterium]|jgi:hypothetical protein
MSILKSEFNLFLKYFPEIELPVLLGEDEHHTFSAENEMLPLDLVGKFLLQGEYEFIPLAQDALEAEEVADENEFIEYIPCFKLPDTEGFHAIVYWKADLLTYEYVLNTFDLQGKSIAAHVIGGMKAEGNQVKQQVTHIQEDGFIYIAEGIAEYEVGTTDFDALDGKTVRLELLNSGKILAL